MTTIVFCPMSAYPFEHWGRPVAGEYCGEIAPHLAGVITLVVHEWLDSWLVSEIETGWRVGMPADSKEGALCSARAICARRTAGDAERGLMSGPDWVREA